MNALKKRIGSRPVVAPTPAGGSGSGGDESPSAKKKSMGDGNSSGGGGGNGLKKEVVEVAVQPFFEVDIQLAAPHVALHPSLDEIQEYC
eukprot:scaffold6314_cov273-Ochromonas_danica.AAC.37